VAERVKQPVESLATRGRPTKTMPHGKLKKDMTDPATELLKVSGFYHTLVITPPYDVAITRITRCWHNLTYL
jgi:hypothetical protein